MRMEREGRRMEGGWMRRKMEDEQSKKGGRKWRENGSKERLKE